MNSLKSLTIAAVGLAATSIAFSDSQIENTTESGDPIYVADDTGTHGGTHRWSAEAFAPDDLHDYGGDYRWPDPATAPNERDVAKTEPLKRGR